MKTTRPLPIVRASPGKRMVRWGLVALVALGLALVLDLGRSSLATDRVAWGHIELDAGQVVPAAAESTAPAPATPALTPVAASTRVPVGPDRAIDRDAPRPRLIRFTADWCGPCQTMKAQVFADAQVADAVHQRFDAYSVDLSQPTAEQEALGQHYAVAYLPTLIVTDAQGQELVRLEHAADAGEFLGWLDRGWQRWNQSLEHADATNPRPSKSYPFSIISR